MLRIGLLAAGVALVAVSPAAAIVGDDDKPPVIQGYIFETTPEKPKPDLVGRLKVPEGYEVGVFASDLGNTRFIDVAPNGDVYVSREAQGDVIRLRDTNGDGKADGPPEIVVRRSGLLGVTVHDDQLYFATATELFSAPIQADGSIGPATQIFKDLPGAGQHHTRHMKFGPDGMLYMGIGSTCNACAETSPENASILRINWAQKSRMIFASGLRHTIGFDWNPKTGEMWGWDQGIDWLGNDLQREEVNKIELGKRYGWPYVMEDGKEYPQDEPPGDVSNQEWAKASENPVLMYTAHAAGMQILFHPGGGAMGDAFSGDAFATMRGSWNRKPAVGYELVRIHYENGEAKEIVPFVTGFLSEDGTSNYGRLCGLGLAKDGAILFSDDTNGVIYRLSRKGAAAADVTPTPPADAMKRQASMGANVPLAIDRPETVPTGKAAKIDVVSSAFEANAPIPMAYTEYGQSVSPPLDWNAVSGAKSYALITEDPDGAMKPVVHWVAWNIPAGTTQFQSGLSEQDRLIDEGLKGTMQGRVSRGSVGYYGPRPPVGDPDHHYHFQVLALDRTLDLPLGASRDDLLAAAKGHVIGRGELVGTFRQSEPPTQ